MESLQTSETTVRGLVADLRPFKLAGDRKTWYAVKDVVDVLMEKRQ